MLPNIGDDAHFPTQGGFSDERISISSEYPVCGAYRAAMSLGPIHIVVQISFNFDLSCARLGAKANT